MWKRDAKEVGEEKKKKEEIISVVKLTVIGNNITESNLRTYARYLYYTTYVYIGTYNVGKIDSHEDYVLFQIVRVPIL